MTAVTAEKLLAGKAAGAGEKAASGALAGQSGAPKKVNVKKAVDAFLPPSRSSRTSADRVFPYVLLVAGGILLFAAVRGYNPAKLTKLILQGKMNSKDWDSAKLKGASDPPATFTPGDFTVPPRYYKKGDSHIPKSAPPAPADETTPPENTCAWIWGPEPPDSGERAGWSWYCTRTSGIVPSGNTSGGTTV